MSERTARRVADLLRGDTDTTSEPQESRRAGGRPKPYRIVTEFADYLECRMLVPVEGGTLEEVEATSYVAKPWHHRASVYLSTAYPMASTYTFQQIDARTRKLVLKSDTSKSEIQVIVPAYVVGETIWAERGIATGLVHQGGLIVLQDCNLDGRAWARRKTQ